LRHSLFEQLNPGKTKTIKAGDQLNVPNVEPFEVNSVKDLKVGSEIAPPVANDIAAENEDKKDKYPSQDRCRSRSRST